MRSCMWPLVPLGWGSLNRRDCLPQISQFAWFFLYQQLQRTSSRTSKKLTWGWLVLFSSGKALYERDFLLWYWKQHLCICLGPAAMAVAGTTCEKLWWERVGRHCLHRVRCHQNHILVCWCLTWDFRKVPKHMDHFILSWEWWVIWARKLHS